MSQLEIQSVTCRRKTTLEVRVQGKSCSHRFSSNPLLTAPCQPDAVRNKRRAIRPREASGFLCVGILIRMQTRWFLASTANHKVKVEGGEALLPEVCGKAFKSGSRSQVQLKLIHFSHFTSPLFGRPALLIGR